MPLAGKHPRQQPLHSGAVILRYGQRQGLAHEQANAVGLRLAQSVEGRNAPLHDALGVVLLRERRTDMALFAAYRVGRYPAVGKAVINAVTERVGIYISAVNAGRVGVPGQQRAHVVGVGGSRENRQTRRGVIAASHHAEPFRTPSGPCAQLSLYLHRSFAGTQAQTQGIAAVAGGRHGVAGRRNAQQYQLVGPQPVAGQIGGGKHYLGFHLAARQRYGMRLDARHPRTVALIAALSYVYLLQMHHAVGYQRQIMHG